MRNRGVRLISAAAVRQDPQSTERDKASDIPVGTGFSPALVDLPSFLRALIAHSGDKPAMTIAVWAAPARIKRKPTPPTTRAASLPLEAARQYGLLNIDYTITDLTTRLVHLSPPQLYDEFARHILLNLRGLRVVEALQQMTIDDVPMTGDTVAQYLTDQGVRVTVHNTAINSLRMWLARASLFDDKEPWKVRATRKETLLGMTDMTIAALAGLDKNQLAYVEALCRINPAGKYLAASVRDLAVEIVGRPFGQASLPKTVLEPLKQAGLIDYESRGTQGGKSSLVWTLPAFNRDVLEPFVQRTVHTLDAVLTEYYTMRPADIHADLNSSNTFLKGKALEAFAIHVMRLLGLRFVAWRKRSRDTTGGNEIDVVMSGRTGLVPTVWQVQCKNTPGAQIRSEQVAREIGLLPLTRATHVLLIANCRIVPDARTYAKTVMRNTSTTIFLLDDKDFERIKRDPTELVAILRDQTDKIVAARDEAIRRDTMDSP